AAAAAALARLARGGACAAGRPRLTASGTPPTLERADIGDASGRGVPPGTAVRCARVVVLLRRDTEAAPRWRVPPPAAHVWLTGTRWCAVTVGPAHGQVVRKGQSPMTSTAKPRTLQEIVDSVPNIAQYLYNNQTGPRIYPVVQPEYTNWRDEQRSWRETACLFDLSYHMTDLYVSGPDAFRLLERLAINSFKGFKPGRAKQMVACSPAGYVIGDVILFYLDEESFNLVGRPSVHNWVQYHAETGGYDVQLERDEWAVGDPNRRRKAFRFQVQGPNAVQILEKLNGGPLPDVKF